MARRRTATKWSNEELVTRMHEAKAFEAPIVQDFLERAENRLFEDWCSSPANESKRREELYLQYLGLAAFKKFIEETIILGKMAEKELADKVAEELKRKGQ